VTGLPFYILVASQFIFLAMQVYFFVRGLRFYREGRTYRDAYRAMLTTLVSAAETALHERRFPMTRPPERRHRRTTPDA
jgi:hypothetical protein